jgi:hypothetical protein
VLAFFFLMSEAIQGNTITQRVERCQLKMKIVLIILCTQWVIRKSEDQCADNAL